MTDVAWLPDLLSNPFCVAALVFHCKVLDTLSNHSVFVDMTVGNGYCEAVMVT